MSSHSVRPQNKGKLHSAAKLDELVCAVISLAHYLLCIGLLQMMALSAVAVHSLWIHLSVFSAISEEANTDRDLWMHPTVGKVLTSVHQSLFTYFIRQGCVKTTFDISLYWNMPDSLAALLSFGPINKRFSILCVCVCTSINCFYCISMFTGLCVCRQMHVFMHPLCFMCTLAYVCLYLWVFPEQSWGEQQLAAVLSPRQH